jgi:hypothetical protein
VSAHLSNNYTWPESSISAAVNFTVYRHYVVIKLRKTYYSLRLKQFLYPKGLEPPASLEIALCLVGIQPLSPTLCWMWSGSLPPALTTCTSTLTHSWVCSAICWRSACASGRICWDRDSTDNGSAVFCYLTTKTHLLDLTFPTAFYVKIEGFPFQNVLLITKGLDFQVFKLSFVCLFWDWEETMCAQNKA